MLPSIINQDFLPFQFENIRLQEACYINGNPYFTAKAIGEFLGYVKPRPDVAIRKIVDRNPHILTFSVDTKLVSTDGKEYTTTLYDPIGLQLIINKSNQPKAVAFQIAVANLVLDFMQGKIKPKIWAADRISAIKQILSYPANQKRKQLVCALAQKENKSLATIYRWLEKAGGLKTKEGEKKHRSYSLAA